MKTKFKQVSVSSLKKGDVVTYTPSAKKHLKVLKTKWKDTIHGGHWEIYLRENCQKKDFTAVNGSHGWSLRDTAKVWLVAA